MLSDAAAWDGLMDWFDLLTGQAQVHCEVRVPKADYVTRMPTVAPYRLVVKRKVPR